MSMTALRAACGLVLASAIGGAAPVTYTLTESGQAGDCYQIHIELDLKGEMHVSREGQPQTLKLGAQAEHSFAERVLVAGRGAIHKTARAYETAKATITQGQERLERGLRPERRLIVAQESGGQALVYAPAGTLTADEIELVGEHFDTLSLAGLLPARAVAVGEKWKPAADVVQYLCGFEGLTGHSLECKVEAVNDKTAKIAISGTANGIDLGAIVKLEIRASAEFDTKANRLTSLEWKQKDERGQGPASPAMTAESTTKLTRLPIGQPASLTDVALISVPDGLDPPSGMTQVSTHFECKTPFDLVCARDWQIVAQTADHLVLRLLDRGDFVAQATITPWDSAKPGQHMTPEAFREAMNKTKGWEVGEIVEETEIPSEKVAPDTGRWLYRLHESGKMDSLKVVQTFYLLASPTGEQVVLAFTMTDKQVDKVGGRDMALIRGLEFCHK
jgi:hypothetical protein